MRRSLIAAPLLLAVMAPSAGAPLAQDLFAYPNEGQSQEQQEQDKFACYQWAREQSGFDPMQAPVASAPAPKNDTPSTGASVVGGAGIGAALGAIGGAIAGGAAGKGAAIGAAGGGLLGGLHSESQKSNYRKERQEWERQQAAQYQQGRNKYNRAYSACMTGRGYTIS